MFGFKRKRSASFDDRRAATAKKNAEFGRYQVLSSGQRTATGDRSEMCAGAMNNNQRLATLQMLQDMKDED